MSCSAYSGVKLLEHAKKIVERVGFGSENSMVSKQEQDAIWSYVWKRNSRFSDYSSQNATVISR